MTVEEIEALASHFLRESTRFYLQTNPNTGKVLEAGIFLPPDNMATPRVMTSLITSLREQTDEMESGVRWETFGGPQTMVERARWAERLEVYENEHARALEESPDVVDQRYWDQVVLPLLLGFYPGEDLQRVPDLVTPLTIMVMAKTITEAHEFAVRQTVQEYRDAAAKIIETVRKTVEKVAGSGLPIVPIAIMAGLLVFGYVKGAT